MSNRDQPISASADRALTFEPADPERHTALLHDWLNRPHVLPWWGPERTVDEARAYIVRQRDSAHLDPWVVSAGLADGPPVSSSASRGRRSQGSPTAGRLRLSREKDAASGDIRPARWCEGPIGQPSLAFGYVETYLAGDDPLADYVSLGERDRGWHVLVGPLEVIGSGLPRQMGRAVLDRLFAEPAVERVVCEPDIRNERMHGFCRALGYTVEATLDLPDKRALLFVVDRATYEKGRA